MAKAPVTQGTDAIADARVGKVPDPKFSIPAAYDFGC
jgi:hypothetical protein